MLQHEVESAGQRLLDAAAEVSRIAAQADSAAAAGQAARDALDGAHGELEAGRQAQAQLTRRLQCMCGQVSVLSATVIIKLKGA